MALKNEIVSEQHTPKDASRLSWDIQISYYELKINW